MTSKRPARFDGWVLFQGADFLVTFTFKDGAGNVVDLNASEAEMQIRDSDGAKIATLASDGTGDGPITLSATSPNVQGSLSAAFTSGLILVDNQTLFFDFKLIGSITEIILEGRITAEVPVTR